MEPHSKRYQRAYVACLNCRLRKVKCDLGNVELPDDRCARCRRERRDCVFVELAKRTAPRRVSQESGLTFLATAAEKARSVLPDALRASPRLTMPVEYPMAAKNGVSAGGLEAVEYIGADGILTAAEAEQLVRRFFSTMHPFFPYIPSFLHSPATLVGYPLLLCTIITIAARYHAPGAVPDGSERHVQIHDRLWIHVQRLILQTVWAEASTRLLGTVFAFLLFTEWNPRAIHWRWADYANREDDGEQFQDLPETQQLQQEPAALGAMRRLYRMAWMLTGLAVRLAQDMGFMEQLPHVFVATHIAETNGVMNTAHRSMLGHLLAEADATGLAFSPAQRAHLELLQIVLLCHETFHAQKLSALPRLQRLAVLGLFSPMLQAWARKHSDFLAPTLPATLRRLAVDSAGDSHDTALLAALIERELLIFEHNYTKVYIYSLALTADPGLLKIGEVQQSARFVHEAVAAASEVLAVAHRVHKLRMLRFMPVRWVVRIVRAVAFMVKCHHISSENSSPLHVALLSLSTVSADDIVASIHKAAITLRDCSPDELHICTRYSTVLMYLCSEMKRKREPPPSSLDKALFEPLDNDVMDWFASNDNAGLDFVVPWTELIEQQLQDLQFSFDDASVLLK